MKFNIRALMPLVFAATAGVFVAHGMLVVGFIGMVMAVALQNGVIDGNSRS